MNDHSILEVIDLFKKYGSTEALSGINLSLGKQEILGLLGPNGAGKTTLLSIIAGLLRPSSGYCEFKINRERVSGFVGNPPLWPHLTAPEHLYAIAGIRGFSLTSQEVLEILHLVNLNDAKTKQCKHYSTGMKQRLGVAQALICKPQLIFLDEPTNGLDPQGIVELRDLILSINIEKKISFIISSHILAEIENIASRICIINNGKKVYDNFMYEALNTNFWVCVKTQDKELTQILAKEFASSCQEENDTLVFCMKENKKISEFNKVLVDNNILVDEIYKKGSGLEKLYFSICNDLNRSSQP